MDRSMTNGFSVQRRQAARYFYWMQIVLMVCCGFWFCGAGVVMAILHSFTLGPWLSRKQSQALHYWLEGGTLRVDQGVFFLKRKAIPLDRVTDVVLAQGPLMKLCGVWELRVQTAGMGQGVPEAALYGLSEPEAVRDMLLAARDDVVGGHRSSVE